MNKKDKMIYWRIRKLKKQNIFTKFLCKLGFHETEYCQHNNSWGYVISALVCIRCLNEEIR